jgi:hypothetical protein
MIIYLPLAIALAGALMYGFCVNPKLQEIGRLSYACGLLGFLLTSAGKLLSVIK